MPDGPQFDLDVPTYKPDSSLRCFHVRLADLEYKKLPNLWLRVIASSGSQLVGYQGFGSESWRIPLRSPVRQKGMPRWIYPPYPTTPG